MRRLINSRPFPWTALAILPSVGLWAMLWLSISPGDPAAIFNPGSPLAFAQGFRAVLPLAAAGAAAIFIGVKAFQRSPRTFGLFGPLGLTTAYALVGLAASLKSPDVSVALWWAALYLSVPVVLLGVVWGPAPLDQLRRLVNATWLVLILASAALFVVAALYLDIIDKILDPTELLKCQPAQWLDLTGGRLRGTGVGRYAAIAGLIAISGVWQAKWRPIWVVVLLTSVTLLLYTGARGSFVGFALAATLILSVHLCYASKRVLLAALLVILVSVPLVWSTGAPLGLVKTCILRISAAPPLFATAPLETKKTTANSLLSVPEQAPTKVLTEVEPQKKQLPDTGASQKISRFPVAAKQSSPDDGVPIDQVAPEEARPQVQPSLESPTFEAPPDGIPFGNMVRKLGTQEFFKFSGRTAVWVEGLGLIKNSPLIGFGFHADRLLLNTHMHNSVLHATLQAGLLGAIPFVAAMIYAWVLFLRIVRRLALLSSAHKHLVVQCGGVLAFFTMRSFPESTGAFFGVDWLILAPVLFYLQLVNSERQPLEVNGDDRILEGT